MLCDKCWAMLRGHEGRVWKGTYILQFEHHQNLLALEDSANRHCSICRKLHEEWLREDDAALAQPSPQPVGEVQSSDSEQRNETGISTIEPFSSEASISMVRVDDVDRIFRLNFVLKSAQRRRTRTFVLKPTGQCKYTYMFLPPQTP